MQSRFARPRLSIFVAPLILVLALTFGAALAQDGAGKSGFVQFLESSLSTPERKVALDGVEDIFSWHPRIAKITVSDKAGKWLELDGVELVWTRAALLQRRLDIDVLRAAKVSVLRKPIASKAASYGAMSAPPLEIAI